MIHGELAAVEFAGEHLAVKREMRILRGIGGDAEEIAIVIPEDDVDRARIAAPDLVDDERRAEIAAAEHRVRTLPHTGERGVELPDVVVDIGQNGDPHGAYARLRIFAANFSRNLRTLGDTTKEQ